MVRLVKFNREPAFSNLFNRYFEGEFAPSVSQKAANIKESEDAFEIDMMVPGYKKEQINIELDDNLLTISADIEAKNEEEGWRKEFVLDSFSRSFQLPKIVNMEGITAEQNDGILRILIPKLKEEQKLKKLIEIV